MRNVYEKIGVEHFGLVDVNTAEAYKWEGVEIYNTIQSVYSSLDDRIFKQSCIKIVTSIRVQLPC